MATAIGNDSKWAVERFSEILLSPLREITPIGVPNDWRDGLDRNKRPKNRRFIPNPDLLPENSIYEQDEEKLTDEQLWLLCDESKGGTVPIDGFKDEIAKLRKYLKQVRESEGFDIDEMPMIGIPSGGLHTAPCSTHMWPQFKEGYQELADLAISAYNFYSGKDYTPGMALKANVAWSACENVYFMTFVAHDHDLTFEDPIYSGWKHFQAKVRVRMEDDDRGYKRVDICRPRAKK